MKIIVFLSIFTGLLTFQSLKAHAKCEVTDKLCVMEEIRKDANDIENRNWRDKTLRELAKAYTHEGLEDTAIKIINDIETPDTKAMTIRGIGMAAADNKWKDKARYKKLFENLAKEAEKIDHPPSYAIAFTYIAMAQAFAKDNEGAMATAKAMKNDALRHKAFGETAEIQAERGDFDGAMASIAAIDSDAYQNKAYGNVARIFVKRGKLKEAYASAQKINNTYSRTEILQSIIDYDNAEENLSANTPIETSE